MLKAATAALVAACIIAGPAFAQAPTKVPTDTWGTFQLGATKDDKGRRTRGFVFEVKAGAAMVIGANSQKLMGLELYDVTEGQPVLIDSRPEAPCGGHFERRFDRAGTYKLVTASSLDEDQRFFLVVYDGVPPPPILMCRPPVRVGPASPQGN